MLLFLEAGEERQGRPVTENFDTLLFAAATPYELDNWIKAINRVIYSVSSVELN